MSSELRDLYQEVILDHSKRPRNCHAVADANRHAQGYNALCGDKVTVYARIEGDRLAEVAFQGSGCAICTASTSVMTEAVTGRTEKEAQDLFEGFHTLVTGDPLAERSTAGLGKLAVFAGVAEFPMRVKCATLPWHTLQAALKNETEAVSTE